MSRMTMVWLFFLLIICSQTVVFAQKGKRKIFGSSQPIHSFLGEDVLLPCQIYEAASAVNMEVRWYKERFNRPVHLYQFHRDWPERQAREYRGRTELFSKELQHGNLSLRLENVQILDSGIYSCFAEDKSWYDEGKIELIVGALGTQPTIFWIPLKNDSDILGCRSTMWHPKPEFVWRDQDGRNMQYLRNFTGKEEEEEDRDGFLTVNTYIAIKKEFNVYSCLVRGRIQSQDWESKMHISKEFYPGVSYWLLVVLSVLVLFLAAVLYITLEWIKMKKQEKKCDNRANFYLACHLSKELDEVRSVRKSEWKWISKFAVDIILDPDTAHPKFIISEDCKRMRRGEEWREVPDNRERFNERRCAVASEGFISGQCYWQVDMGENRGWALGVIKASAERKGNLKMTPALGYWVLWHENNLVKALTEERTELFVTKVPKIVGVYLDYEERQVSFYNAAIRSHIYTYVGMDFDTEEKLFPLFYLWDWRSDLTIFTVSSELQAEVAPIREAIQTDQS
ncbi:butyrophilin subfamily 2 member A2-like isoform X2 [Polypterus senegalus]|nr:butyrophilin subfamily 2 member A2-like isoform X2 [Polypterus senegalus]XP_039617958.1 butyrophilin subfamily 2 member A2-like isoform X2 [Polypterus senegalus]XP_039617965.1 butyrophilin subfamily 2 member A2-like isoform X2 [Polypterus senegalus]